MKREYPKTLIAIIETSTVSGYGELEKFREVVYNKTEYDSFIQRWRVNHKCIIKEKSPTWGELKGNWILKRIYYLFPGSLVYMLGVFTGWLLTNYEKIASVWKLLNTK